MALQELDQWKEVGVGRFSGQGELWCIRPSSLSFHFFDLSFLLAPLAEPMPHDVALCTYVDGCVSVCICIHSLFPLQWGVLGLAPEYSPLYCMLHAAGRGWVGGWVRKGRSLKPWAELACGC